MTHAGKTPKVFASCMMDCMHSTAPSATCLHNVQVFINCKDTCSPMHLCICAWALIVRHTRSMMPMAYASCNAIDAARQ